jgi:hypothetical protein
MMLATLFEYRDLLEHIAQQVPARVLPSIKMRIRSDVYGLGPELIVTDAKGRQWRSKLQSGWTVSDEFLAWLVVIE